MKITNIFLIFIISADIAISYKWTSYNYTGYEYRYLNESINSTKGMLQQNGDDSSVLLYVNYEKEPDYHNSKSFSIDDVTIMKTGKSSNLDESLSYCINSAVLVSGHSITLHRDQVRTSDEGAISLCATHSGSINVYSSTISTQEKNSIAMHASENSSLSGRDSYISTIGENSPAISGQKGSWISINNCQLYTSKKGSPLLTTLGSLEIKNTNGSAKNSHAIIVDVPNGFNINNTILNCSWEGDGDGTSDISGILFKNTSFDPKRDSYYTVYPIDLSIKNSILEINSEIVPMILIDDVYSNIYLRNVKVKSRIFLKFKSTKRKIHIELSSCDIEGDIIGDEQTNINIYLSHTKFKGAINPDNKAGYISIEINSYSNITLTDNSNCDAITNSDYTNSNIMKNSFTFNGLEENSSSSLLIRKMILLLLICLMI